MGRAGSLPDAFARGLAAVADEIYLNSVIEMVGAMTEPQSLEGTVNPGRLEHEPEAWIRGPESAYGQPEMRTHGDSHRGVLLA